MTIVHDAEGTLFNSEKKERALRRIASTSTAIVMLSAVIVLTAYGSRTSEGAAAPVFGIKIPAGYRDWRLISLAHEEGTLNDIRVVLGNDKAINSYRESNLPFPDGTIITRLAWRYVPSEENNRAFGRAQSFVPGVATDSYLQLMVKDSKKYAATGGWGFAQFNEEGKPGAEAIHKTCFPCHEAAKGRDFVFTYYAR